MLLLSSISNYYIGMVLHFWLFKLKLDIIYVLMEYSHIAFYTSICYFFAHQATIILPDKDFFKKVGKPLIISNIIYLIGFLAYLIEEAVNDIDMIDCRNVLWLYVRIGTLALSGLFVVIGYKTTRTLRNIRREDMFYAAIGREYELW
jgi:hypothetical protein